MSEEVKAFLECTFRRCITKRKRLEISREYPKPKLEVMSVAKADKDIASILDKEFPAKEDKELSRVQAAVLASSAPITNLWLQMSDSGFTGKPDEVMITKEIIKMTKESLALIGNSSHYITTTRRTRITDKIKPTRPQLAQFLSEVCSDSKGPPENSGKELFGPPIKKKITERAETIKSFNEALAKIDAPRQSKPGQGCFLGKSSGGKYSTTLSSQHPELYQRKQVFKPFQSRKRPSYQYQNHNTNKRFQPKGKTSE